MKAVIMAGGMGTRLQPLTSSLPKPMVPLLNRPVLEYVIKHLKDNGIKEIIMALCWKSDVIERYFENGSRFGVRISYIMEKSPLGTAGCLKRAAPFLNDTFLVVSGDTICNFNVKDGLISHTRSSCKGTVFAVRKSQTGEYGSIIADKTGRVLRFMEKPYKTEVYSEFINAGMYIFEPSVLERIPEGVPQDISKDILPMMLAEGIHMHEADGYWSDIGTHSEYRTAQFDLLNGVEGLTPQWMADGKRKNDSVYIEKGGVSEYGAVCIGPVLIGEGAVVEKGCQIGPYVILGEGTRVREGSSIQHTICWSRQKIHPGTKITGSVLANSCEIKGSSELKNGSVLGERVVLEGGNVVKEHVMIWPKHIIAKGAQIDDTFTGRYFNSSVFTIKGRVDLSLAEGGPVKAAKLAQALTAAYGKNRGVIAGNDGTALSGLFMNLFTESLRSFGCHIYFEEDPIPPSALRNGCHTLRRLGVYAVSVNESCTLLFFDSTGQILSAEMEKSIELHYSKATPVKNNVAGTKTRIAGLAKELESVFMMTGSPVYPPEYGLEMDPLSFRFYRDLLEGSCLLTVLSPAAKQHFRGLKLIFFLDEQKQTLSLKGEHGNLPLNSAILHELFQQDLKWPEAETPIHLLAALIEGMRDNQCVKTKLDLYSKAACQHVSCKTGQENQVLSRLISEEDLERVRLSDGVNILHGEDSWTRITAVQNDAGLTVITMNSRPEEALKTNEVYTNKIKHFQK
ncbi:NDP-sugar synthase [Bacillus sp. FJAT-42376]|uniref:sugar phosphate nucleotidyltransferase n=1 Tax=Bacillus sp. FJAT-42376 TaxID=2014076 RepID=UPI000F4D9F87|nr:NDP-sugar synthase [Bacillus sp. FJAT-42376]AZB43621.1 NDP-sugar synthase [Bacillus sp. FJAT-42376]